MTKKIMDKISGTYGLAWVPVFEVNNLPEIKKLLIQRYADFGYFTKPGDVFWRIEAGENEGLYGLQVGQYQHSCHIDTTDIIVVLVKSEKDIGVEDHSDLWLSNRIVV